MLVALAFLAGASCSGAQRQVRESCLVGDLGASCFTELPALTEGETPEAAVALLRRFVAAQVAVCDATYLRPRDADDPPVVAGHNLCQAFAAMRLGARVPLADRGDGRLAALQARAEPLLARDFEKGMRTLQAMCEPGDRGHALACARLGLLAQLEGVPVATWYLERACVPLGFGVEDRWEVCRARLGMRPDFAGWPDATVRSTVARGLLARAETEASGEGSSRTQHIAAARALLASTGDEADRALGEGLAGRVQASARDDFEAMRADLERRPASDRPLDAALYALGRMREAIARMEEADRPAAQARFDQTVDALTRAESARFEGRNWFGPALRVFTAAATLGRPSPTRARMRAELEGRAAAFHRERASRNAAAGRPFAARFHAGLERRFGGRAAPGAVDPQVEALLRGGRALRYDAAQCPWAAAALPAPTTAAPSPSAMEVSIQWTRCAADERRWQARETVQVEESYEVTEEVTETQTITEQHCTDSYSTTTVQTSRGSTSVPVTRRSCSPETRVVRTTVPRTVRRTRTVPASADVSHRQIQFALVGTITVTRWGRAETRPFDYSHAPVDEVAYTARGETRAFTDVTLEGVRRLAVQALAADGLSEAIRGLETAQAEAEEAAGQAAADDDTREEHYVRAHLACRGRPQPVIERHFADRYGIEAAELAQALSAQR